MLVATHDPRLFEFAARILYIEDGSFTREEPANPEAKSRAGAANRAPWNAQLEYHHRQIEREIRSCSREAGQSYEKTALFLDPCIAPVCEYGTRPCSRRVTSRWAKKRKRTIITRP